MYDYFPNDRAIAEMKGENDELRQAISEARAELKHERARLEAILSAGEEGTAPTSAAPTSAAPTSAALHVAEAQRQPPKVKVFLQVDPNERGGPLQSWENACLQVALTIDDKPVSKDDVECILVVENVDKSKVLMWSKAHD